MRTAARMPAPDLAALVRERTEAERARRCVESGTLAVAWYRQGGNLVLHRFLRQISAECDRWVAAFVARAPLALSLHAPPGHGKSESVGRSMPPRAMALAPGRSIVYVTSTSDRAKEVSLSVRATVGRLSAAYPHLMPHPDGPWTDLLWRTAGGGWWTALSPGGSTGGVDAHGIVFDDVTGSEARQRSKAEREALYRFIEGDALTRFRGVGPMMNMETRRGLGDATDFLAGRLGDGFDIRDWAWIAGEQARLNPWDGRAPGEYLWPERYGPDYHQSMMPHLVPGHPVFQSQYQQRPIREGGSVILEAWLSHRYTGRPEDVARTCRDVLICVDPAAKTSERHDPTGIVILGRLPVGAGDIVCVLHVEAVRREAPDTEQRIADLAGQWTTGRGKTAVIIEDTSVGQAWIPNLRRRGLAVMPVQVAGRGDKVQRMHPHLARFAAGEIRLPESAPWVAPYVAEMASVPDCEHDDRWDATCLGLTWYADASRAIQPARPMRLVGA